jgi:hypothetical protein
MLFKTQLIPKKMIETQGTQRFEIVLKNTCRVELGFIPSKISAGDVSELLLL